MKTIIAYVQLVFGFPILVASLLSFIPSLLFATTWGRSAPTSYNFVLNLIEGILSILCASLIFQWLDVSLNLAVPIILAVVTYFWNSARKEAAHSLPAVIGIAVGYLIWVMW